MLRLYSVPRTERIQVVIFISDGEITSNDRLRSYERLADYVDVGGVLGYGTTSGGESSATTTTQAEVNSSIHLT